MVAKGNRMAAQPRVELTSVVLQQNTLPAAFTRRATRAELMVAGAPLVIGHDSTTNQKALPGTWTLVSETSVQGRKDGSQESVRNTCLRHRIFRIHTLQNL